jgi:hypothetical protein
MPDMEVEDEPARVVLAPATHARLDPNTKALHAYQKPGADAASSRLPNGDAAGGNHLADVIAGTGAALVCMTLVALVALLYAPRKSRQSSVAPPAASSGAGAREESLELGGVRSSWAASAVDQALDDAARTEAGKQ